MGTVVRDDLRRKIRTGLTIAVAALAIDACSGGGGSPPTAQTVPSASASPSPSVTKSPMATATPTFAPTQAPALSTVTAAPADAFVDSIGVGTHFSYSGTSYVTNFTAISTALIASGIRHILDGGINDPYAASLAYLGQHGIMHAVTFPTTTTASQITSTLASYAPYVEIVQPQNEYDLDASSDPNWATTIANEQQLLWTTLRSNSAYNGIKILGPSFAQQVDAAAVGPLDQYEDYGSLHDYTCTQNPGTSGSYGIPNESGLLRKSTVTDPIMTTEVGYGDNPELFTCAVPDQVIAKFDPRTFAERWLAGEPRTYMYQFADMAPGENFNSMGLVGQDGSPKPQYTAMQSMISLLSDPGAAFTTSPLNYGIFGLTTGVHQMLLQKRDGSYYLMLWLEVPGYDATSGAALTVAPQTVTLQFAKAPASESYSTYASNWTLQTTPVTPSASQSITLTDSITFVHVKF